MSNLGREGNAPGNEVPIVQHTYDPEILARHALAEGIFDLIHIPYGSFKHNLLIGTPMDIPDDTIKDVRHGFMKANELLLPTDALNIFFEQHVLEDPSFFDSAGALFTEAAQHVRLIMQPSVSMGQAFGKAEVQAVEAGRSEELNNSFGKAMYRQEDVFYTKERKALLLVFLKDNPEIVVMLTGYLQGLQNYLSPIRESMISLGQGAISSQNLEDLDAFIGQWGNVAAFMDTFTAGIAACHYIGMRHAPEVSPKDLINADLFYMAAQYIGRSGAFVTKARVPAEFAALHRNGEYNVICAGLPAIQRQHASRNFRPLSRHGDAVADTNNGGTLLEALYEKVLREKDTPGSAANVMTGQIAMLLQARYRELIAGPEVRSTGPEVPPQKEAQLQSISYDGLGGDADSFLSVLQVLPSLEAGHTTINYPDGTKGIIKRIDDETTDSLYDIISGMPCQGDYVVHNSQIRIGDTLMKVVYKYQGVIDHGGTVVLEMGQTFRINKASLQKLHDAVLALIQPHTGSGSV